MLSITLTNSSWKQPIPVCFGGWCSGSASLHFEIPSFVVSKGNGETLLLSFLCWGSFNALLGKGDFAYGALALRRIFPVNPSLWLVNPSPERDLIFASMWRMKIPKKVKFIVWQILHERVNTLDRVSRKMSNLMGSWYCILVEGQQQRTLIICFRVVILLMLCGLVSLISLVLIWLANVTIERWRNSFIFLATRGCVLRSPCMQPLSKGLKPAIRILS